MGEKLSPRMSLDHWLACWSFTAQLKCFFPECVSMWFFRLKACVAVFYIVCTCTVNSCRATLQYDGQASLNYQSNKCNLCNYAWSDPSAFRPHLITHDGEKYKNVNNVTLHLIACWVWGIIWKQTVEKKIKQMQPVWFCILWCKQFEDAFENTQWRKIKQMQLAWLCILWCN